MKNKKETKNFHIVIVKYLPATNSRGTRVKLISERFENDSIILPYDYKFNSALDIAVNWLQGQYTDIIGQGSGHKHDYVVLDTIEGLFTPLKQL